MSDIDHPSHYGGDVQYEAIKLIEDWGFGYGFCMGSAIKYNVRAGSKDGEAEAKDKGKAIWYLERATRLRPVFEERLKRLGARPAAAFHKLDEERTEALIHMARRDPESALRFLMAS